MIYLYEIYLETDIHTYIKTDREIYVSKWTFEKNTFKEYILAVWHIV